jgi:heat shock protein HslJ
MRVLIGLAAAGVLLAACGSDDEGGGDAPTAADLDSATYTSTEVSGHDLAENTTVTLTFEDGTLAVDAGCNTQSAAYEVSGGTLVWSGPAAATLKACPPPLGEQDHWLGGLFTDGMDASLDGDTLTLTNDEVTMKLSS